MVFKAKIIILFRQMPRYTGYMFCVTFNYILLLKPLTNIFLNIVFIGIINRNNEAIVQF